MSNPKGTPATFFVGMRDKQQSGRVDSSTPPPQRDLAAESLFAQYAAARDANMGRSSTLAQDVQAQLRALVNDCEGVVSRGQTLPGILPMPRYITTYNPATPDYLGKTTYTRIPEKPSAFTDAAIQASKEIAARLNDGQQR